MFIKKMNKLNAETFWMNSERIIAKYYYSTFKNSMLLQSAASGDDK